MLEYVTISPVTDQIIINLSAIFSEVPEEQKNKDLEFCLSFLDKDEVLKNLDNEYVISLDSLQKINHPLTIKACEDVLCYFDVERIEDIKSVTVNQNIMISMMYLLKLYIHGFKMFNEHYSMSEILDTIDQLMSRDKDNSYVKQVLLEEHNIQPFEVDYIMKKFKL